LELNFVPALMKRQPAFGRRAVKLWPEIKLGFFVVRKRRKPLVLWYLHTG